MDRKRIIICFIVLYAVGGMIAVFWGLEQEKNADNTLQVSEVAEIQEEKPLESLVYETEHLNDIQNTEDLQGELNDSTEEEVSVPETKEEVSVPETEEEQTDTQSEYWAVVKRVGDKRLNVRKQPSMSGEIIGSMVKDDVAQVIEIGEEWHLIRFRNLEGYVSAKYMELIEVSENDKS